MSQYTFKIKQIAQDFAEIEMYESASALEGRDGMLIIHYKHGGKTIEFTRTRYVSLVSRSKTPG